jgi:voltage-gated potassium channel
MKRGLYHFEQSRTLRLSFYLFLLVAVLATGTAGYHWIEGWSPDEALYMTVITVSTVGFTEVHPLSPAGRLFTILLIFFGVTSVALSLTALFEFFVLRGLTTLFGRGKMDSQIAKLNQHTILCGYGRTGYYIARDLLQMKKPFVVIESDPDRIQLLEQDRILHLAGDPSDEDLLTAAGVERATALVAALPKDSDTLFLTVSARSLSRRLHIIARVQDPDNSRKFIKAGADQVVSPFSTGATRIVQLLTRPEAVDLIELVTPRESLTMEVCEIPVEADSDFSGKTLVEARVRQTLGCMVAAVRRAGGEMVFDPDPQMRLEVGDVLLTIQKPRAAGSS